MRAHIFHALALALALSGGCKWGEFDDLEDTTWVRSTQSPDIGSSDYAVAIVGVDPGSNGGTLAVLSDDTSNYSTIEYSSKGEADLGPNPVKLGMQQIGAVSDVPVFVTNAAGDRIGIVERAITGGNYAVVIGTPTAPAGIEFAAMGNPAPAPDAGVFDAMNNLIFAAGGTLYTVPASGGTPIACQATDNATMPLAAVAMAIEGTNLWVWTKGGELISYALSNVMPCGGGSIGPNTGVTFFMPPGGFMPAAGARVHIVGNFAILTGHPATGRMGEVFVVKLSDGSQVGTTLNVDGLRSSELLAVDSGDYLVLGIPDRSNDGVVSGAVDVLPFDASSGALDATPATTLHDAHPESGQLFGRAVTTMKYNGKPIIVVGATDEIFAYYKTAIYDQLP